MKSLDQLASDIREANRNSHWNVVDPGDWPDTYKIPAALALIHSEVSEALEEFRADKRENFIEELADIQIRLLDLAGGMTTAFEQAVIDKVRKNSQRTNKRKKRL